MHSSDRTLLASLGFADPDKKDRRHTLASQYLAQPEVAKRIARSLIKREFLDAREMTQELAVELSGAPTPEPTSAQDALTYSTPQSWRGSLYDLGAARGKLEVEITRGRGYLVGFWDVVVPMRWHEPWAVIVDRYARPGKEPRMPTGWFATGAGEQERHRREMEAYDRDFEAYRASEKCFVRREVKESGWVPASFNLRIEVKVRPVDVADIARQIALYLADNRPNQNDLTVVATCYPMSALDRDTLREKGIHHIRLGAPFEEWCRAQADVNPAESGQEF